MNILKSIMGKVSGKQELESDEGWIEIKSSLDELDNMYLAEAAKSSL